MPNFATLMEKFTTNNLCGVTPKAFESKIKEFLAGQTEEKLWMATKREFKNDFFWGHNHNFGDFVVSGKMGNRHIVIAEKFGSSGDLPESLSNKTVLVIGCWTGGDALLLSGLGASFVCAIEENERAAQVATYLFNSFGVKGKVYHESIEFPLNAMAHSRFDLIYCAGVFYHLENPIKCLDNMRHMLRSDGKLLLESMVMMGEPASLEQYPRFAYAGSSTSGYNWFIPNNVALLTILKDRGFRNVKDLGGLSGHHERMLVSADG
jgi:SAM-dependent methyltransferase